MVGILQIHQAQARHLARGVALVVGAVVPELPRAALPPALEAARVQQGTGVGPSGLDPAVTA